MEVNSAEINISTANVAIVTTTEKLIIASPPITLERPNATFLIMAWAQVTSGTNGTALTPRIYLGATEAGTLLGEGNAVTLAAAAGGNEQLFIMASTVLTERSSAQFCLSIQQTTADGNATALQSGIVVFQLN